MSITSSKISFGTQFKAHIGANRAARHLRLKKLGNKQKKKVVQSIMTSTVRMYAVLWVYDLMLYTTSSFWAAEASAPDQGFETDPEVV